MIKRTLLFLLTTIILIYSQSAFAATVTWSTGTSGTWVTPASWSTGSVPTAADDVVIPTAVGTITVVNTSVTVSSIKVGSGSTLSLNWTGTGGGTSVTSTNGLTNDGNIIMNNVASGIITLTVTNGLLQNSVGATISDTGSNGANNTISANISNAGNFTVTKGITLNKPSGSTSTGTITIDASASLVISAGTLTVQPGGILQGSGTLDTSSLAAASYLSSYGVIRPGGGATGTLTLNGGGSHSGIIDIDLYSASVYDRISVPDQLHSYSFSGTLKLTTSLTSTYTPTIGDSFMVLGDGGATSFSVASFIKDYPPLGGGKNWLTTPSTPTTTTALIVSIVSDTTLPTVLSTSPTSSATNVPVNSVVSAVFSEAMDSSTITNSTFIVSDSTSSIVSGTFVYSVGTQTAVFQPSSSLAVAMTYTATITAGAKDLAGNLLTPKSWSFTTVIPSYAVTATTGSNGTISPASRLVSHGSTTTFTVTPNAGYTASVGGTCGGSLAGTIFTTNAITAPCTVTASFTPNLTVTKSGTGGGIVTSNTGTLIWSGTTGTATLNSGTTVTLTAAPATGSLVTVWTGCDTSSGNTCTVSMVSAKNISVFFAAIPRTGQTTPYASGDDGNRQAGVAWPSPRFTVSGTVVTDNLTGLIWPQDGGTPSVGLCTGGTTTWQDALNYVACLNTNNYLGFNDWHLPNVNELRSLVINGQLSTATWLTAQGFANVQTVYWSSTTVPNATGSAWANVSYSNKTTTGYVWPVRSGPCGASGSSAMCLPRTGQTIIYAAGDDGSLQAGAAWSSPRFTPMSAGTGTVVTDNLTGLVWLQDGSTPPVGTAPLCTFGVRSWQSALDYVACLNTNSYLGYNDWRLPNVNELRSLVNAGQAATWTWLNTQGFTNTQFNYYWSSTTNASITSSAWYVYMVNGDMGLNGNDKVSSYLVWPVRAGQSGSFASLTISKSGTGTGVVTPDTGTISWTGSSGIASYPTGSAVTLTATPDSGSIFAGWSGACTGTGTCLATMTTDTSVTATFGINTYTITASAGSSGGTITPSGSIIMSSGTNTTFTIMPDPGYHIADVVVDFVSVGTVTTYPFSNVSADHTISAVFASDAPTIGVSPLSFAFSANQGDTATQSGILTMSNTGLGALNWTVASTASWLLLTSAATGTDSGTVTFTVDPTGLSGGINTAYLYITAPGATNTGTYVYVYFTISGQTLSVSLAGNSGFGTVTSAPTGITCTGVSTCVASYVTGTVVTLTAAPDAGSTFTGWSGACVGTSSCLVTMNSPTTVHATFISATTLGGRPQEGNLQITLIDDGKIGITRFVAGTWQDQVYSWDSKGSRLQFLTSGTTTAGYALGYFSGTDLVTLVSNTRTGNNQLDGLWTAVTNTLSTTGMQVALQLLYQPGDSYYSLKWNLINQSGGALTDVRFFHGEDTYFLGGDSGAGFWDAPNNTIGVQKTDSLSGQLMRMSLQSVTAPYAYDSEYYSTVRSNVVLGALTNTIDPTESTDNGYALEWRNPAMANGAAWTIQAYEKFADVAVGSVAVTAPILTNCAIGSACDLTYTVHNLTATPVTVNLSSSIDLAGWGATIQFPLSTGVTITAGAAQPVIIQVAVPPSAAIGTVARVTLSADDLTNKIASDTGSVQASLAAQTLAVTNVVPGLKSIATSANVAYTLSENALEGTVSFTRTSGAADSASHSYSLAGELVAGSHAVTTGITLVDGAFYTALFQFTDKAGNPITVSNTMVFYDSNYGKGPVGNIANEDGLNIVNEADVAKLNSVMGSRPGDADWNPACDLNKDNRVDQKDLMLLRMHFGE